MTTIYKLAALSAAVLVLLISPARAETVKAAQFWPSSYVQDNLIALGTHAGAFARHGVSAEIFNINNDISIERSSLTDGKADVGLDLYNLRFNPEKLTVVAAPFKRTLYTLVAAKAFNGRIESLVDLGGKVVGTYGCSKLGTVLLMNSPAFKAAGLSVKCGVENPRDPSVVYLDASDPGTRKARLQAGKLAAIVDFARRGYELSSTGNYHVILGPEGFNGGITVPPIVFAFGPKVPEAWYESGGVIDRFLAAIAHTRMRLETDPEGMRPVVAKTFKVGPAADWRDVPAKLPDDFPQEAVEEVAFLEQTLIENVAPDLCGPWDAASIAASAEIYQNGGTREMVEARGEEWQELPLDGVIELRCVE